MSARSKYSQQKGREESVVSLVILIVASSRNKDFGKPRSATGPGSPVKVRDRLETELNRVASRLLRISGIPTASTTAG
jgi:hypothetical protein